MYYYNRYKSDVMVGCNYCDRIGRLSRHGYTQLFHGTLNNPKHEYYGWIRTDDNITVCPDCVEKLKEGVERVKFHIIATEGFNDKELLESALRPLKGLGHTFSTSIKNQHVVEVVRFVGLPTSYNEVDKDVAHATLIFHHVGEDVSKIIEEAKGKAIHVYASTKEKAVNPYMEHLQTLIDPKVELPTVESGEQEEPKTEEVPVGEEEKPTE